MFRIRTGERCRDPVLENLLLRRCCVIDKVPILNLLRSLRVHTLA